MKKHKSKRMAQPFHQWSVRKQSRQIMQFIECARIDGKLNEKVGLEAKSASGHSFKVLRQSS